MKQINRSQSNYLETQRTEMINHKRSYSIKNNNLNKKLSAFNTDNYLDENISFFEIKNYLGKSVSFFSTKEYLIVVKNLEKWVNKAPNQTEKNTRSIAQKKIIHAYEHQATKLNLSKINLTSLPPSKIWSSMSNLKEINLSYNQITKIEDNAFNGLINLETLDLYNNNLTKILASNFNSLNNLKKLDLSNNQINSIDANAFSILTRLNILILSNNYITIIKDNYFNKLINLEELILSYNKIRKIEDNAFTNTNLTRLITLDLIYNNIITLDIDKIWSELIHLETLDLTGNSVDSNSEDTLDTSY